MRSQSLPLYHSQPPSFPERKDSKSSSGTKVSYYIPPQQQQQQQQQQGGTLGRSNTGATSRTNRTYESHQSRSSQNSRSTHRSYRSHDSRASGNPLQRPPLVGPADSSSTLIGSAMERKVNGDAGDADPNAYIVSDTTERLEELRTLMQKEKDPLDYYLVPSEDGHNSEYVAESDQRRRYISGFTGSAGAALITMDAAYLITDSRYWVQASQQLDQNWTLVKAGAGPEYPADWVEFLIVCPRGTRVGVDGRMVTYSKVMHINSKIQTRGCKMAYPIQNLVDMIWKSKPPKSREPVFVQPVQYAGESADSKLERLRDWIRSQPPDVGQFSRGQEPKPSQIARATLITHLPSIAYLLNLRGSDIPYNPLFHAFLYVGLQKTVLFLESFKSNDQVTEYLSSLGIERRDYTEIWNFLRKRDWDFSEGKIIITPDTSYTISLVISHMRCMVLQSFVEEMMGRKNKTELDGLRRAYLRDGVAFTQFLAWLETKLSDGYDITEWEASHRLNEFRKKQKNFMGQAYEPISASGPNAALPHYSAKKRTASMIDRNLPYLNDSGGQYLDGTCDTTRTVHFGRPDNEMCEAYTRVLQGHIAIDQAIFPKGTSGYQLDVLARKALWKDGLNYGHGTGHGFGSFLTVHEGPHSFSSRVPLEPGNVITIEPGFYNEGRWGMRIESALVVTPARTRGSFGGENNWLCFERLTAVPIQTRMVKDSMLTKEEKMWLKEHNQKCYDLLAPYMKDDKRALKWLRRESDRGIGLANPGPGGIAIDWG
ncbi:Creatinase/aminopeptidase [Dendrothele bispora CBS 962.96]|uniref:Creatinase/aminopeptidase n=1 Tax=Dendrothele bispora (strain CBS 962.96) TaxID=1314807 RepID=A0A4S8LPI1_DENBC|nr:Creatinase/aminopeptidase [Dendrothele bispora CBS 962.96]